MHAHTHGRQRAARVASCYPFSPLLSQCLHAHRVPFVRALRRELALSGNALTSLPAEVFTGLTSLRYVTAPHTRARMPRESPTPRGLCHARTPLLTCALVAVRARALSCVSPHRTLWLRSNSLTSLPATIFTPLTSLTYVERREKRGRDRGGLGGKGGRVVKHIRTLTHARHLHFPQIQIRVNTHIRMHACA